MLEIQALLASILISEWSVGRTKLLVSSNFLLTNGARELKMQALLALFYVRANELRTNLLVSSKFLLRKLASAYKLFYLCFLLINKGSAGKIPAEPRAPLNREATR